MAKILIVSASGVKNLELSNKFHEHLHASQHEAKVLNLIDMNMPLYTSVSETQHNAKDLLGEWYDVIHSAQGFIFVAPEYNGGTPPLFTNFLAWVSRSSKNWRDAFNSKPAIIATHSGGGGQHVLMSMRMQLSFIGMNVLGRQILTHSQKPLDEAVLKSASEQLVKYC